MKVLVTGGAGFIGSHVCEHLILAGHEVLVIDNFDDFYDPAIKRRNVAALLGQQGFTLVETDIREPSSLARACEESGVTQAELVIHLAARAGVRPSIAEPIEYSRTNLDGTVAVLELARELGARKFIFGSSSSVYGNNVKVPFSEVDPVDHPISPYAATKRAGELMAHTYHHLYGVSVVCLRFFTVYGPRQRPDLAIHKFTRLLTEGRPVPLFGDGSMQRDYTYVADILQGVEGAIRLLNGAPDPIYEIINLGESRTTTTARLIELIAHELGVSPKIDRQPPQPGDVDRTFADISKARRLLGYDPSTDIEDGIPLFVEWFLENRGAESA